MRGASTRTEPRSEFEVRQRGAVEVDVGVARDVALLRRVLEQRRQVEMANREIAGDRLARRRHVGHELAGHAPGRRSHVHVDAEPIGRPVDLELERRLQLECRRAPARAARFRAATACPS